jgi:DNA-directed RNA polymerase subunit RPC12/RpoP
MPGGLQSRANGGPPPARPLSWQREVRRMIEYRCAGCGRAIRTSDDMQGREELCAYCGQRNRVGEEAGKVATPDELHLTAKGSVVCAAVSFLWAPLLFISPLLVPLAAVSAGIALALASKAVRGMPPDSELADRVRRTAAIGSHLSLGSLGLLAAVAVLLWATGWKPWSIRPDPTPVPGPAGPPRRTRPVSHTQKWTISRNSCIRRSTSSRVAAASFVSEKSSSSMLATTVP